MHRVVFDTNVLISAFIYGGNPERLFDLARYGELQLITSPDILMEFASILKEKFAWVEADIAEAIKAVGYSSELVRPTERLSVVFDDADNRILECALAGKAGFIISGDHHLLELKEYEGIRMVRAKDLLRCLQII